MRRCYWRSGLSLSASGARSASTTTEWADLCFRDFLEVIALEIAQEELDVESLTCLHHVRQLLLRTGKHRTEPFDLDWLTVSAYPVNLKTIWIISYADMKLTELVQFEGRLQTAEHQGLAEWILSILRPLTSELSCECANPITLLWCHALLVFFLEVRQELGDCEAHVLHCLHLVETYPHILFVARCWRVVFLLWWYCCACLDQHICDRVRVVLPRAPLLPRPTPQILDELTRTEKFSIAFASFRGTQNNFLDRI
jgi:hypothetical protein